MGRVLNYPLNKSPFYRLGTKKKLAEILMIDKSKMLKISKEPKYRSFKKVIGEKERNIDAPKKQLKELQVRIKDLLARIETPEWLFSGKKGVSYIDNAKFHQNARFVLTCDIKSFYPSCTKERIFQIFRYTFKTTEDVAWVLANILSHDEKLPTGSPSSQIIAFWAYYPTFLRIHRKVLSYDCKVSLYVDDITISSSKSISKKLVVEIKNELEKVGHTIKNSKTKHYNKNDFKLVTGVAISPNGNLQVPNKRRKKLVDSTQSENVSSKSIMGQIYSAQMIVPSFGEELLQKIKRNIK